MSTTQGEEINYPTDEINVTNNDVEESDTNQEPSFTTFVEESYMSTAKITSENSEYDQNL